jgi:hypothetical protein
MTAQSEWYEVQGLGLHVMQESEGHWVVWLEPEVGAKYIGLCVGAGTTRDAAVTNAVTTLEEAAALLQETPNLEEAARA